MAFQKDAFQNNAFQVIQDLIVNLAKLIFKNPNDKPFKIASVMAEVDSNVVRMYDFKGTKCYFTLINPTT
jgi:hypothetical protein